MSGRRKSVPPPLLRVARPLIAGPVVHPGSPLVGALLARTRQVCQAALTPSGRDTLVR